MLKKMLFTLALLWGGHAMATEEPSFKLIKKNDIYEIRHYPAILVAQTTIHADFDDAGNQGFKILADYIFGNNQAQTKISGTTITSQKKSEKIAMTAPVNMEKTQEGFLIEFTMPAKFSLATLPKPNDPRVIIREVSPRTVAVIRYAGSWSQEKYQEKLHILMNALAKDGIHTHGEPIFARFNSPFQLWFLRRNEIWVEINSNHKNE